MNLKTWEELKNADLSKAVELLNEDILAMGKREVWSALGVSRNTANTFLRKKGYVTKTGDKEIFRHSSNGDLVSNNDSVNIISDNVNNDSDSIINDSDSINNDNGNINNDSDNVGKDVDKINKNSDKINKNSEIVTKNNEVKIMNSKLKKEIFWTEMNANELYDLGLEMLIGVKNELRECDLSQKPAKTSISLVKEAADLLDVVSKQFHGVSKQELLSAAIFQFVRQFSPDTDAKKRR